LQWLADGRHAVNISVQQANRRFAIPGRCRIRLSRGRRISGCLGAVQFAAGDILCGRSAPWMQRSNYREICNNIK
jgi:hypothetical protein